jgi:hypothetical protein
MTVVKRQLASWREQINYVQNHRLKKKTNHLNLIHNVLSQI